MIGTKKIEKKVSLSYCIPLLLLFQQNLESVLKLLEKHSNFERLLLKQEERFYALERLTTFELRNARQKQMEMARKEKEEKDRLGTVYCYVA